MKATVKLHREASHRAMENAIRTQAQVVLEAPVFGNMTVNGFLISGDDSALLMEVTGQLPVPVEALLGAHCEARLYSDQQYCFSSVIEAAPHWGHSRSLAITRPAILDVMERRRFLRAKLAPSTGVKLECDCAGANHRHTGAMLNISPEGLACRVDNGAAAVIGPGSAVRVRFELPELNRLFDLEATVCNRTPASEGFTIIGLHFKPTAGAVEELAALRGVLQDPATVVSESEAYA
ncbi:MAG: PilZ domain-containing protein [Phycisphaerae bacterium]|nr:PilZ domain-containing protein [Phycisphaerae bacterium]